MCQQLHLPPDRNAKGDLEPAPSGVAALKKNLQMRRAFRIRTVVGQREAQAKFAHVVRTALRAEPVAADGPSNRSRLLILGMLQVRQLLRRQRSDLQGLFRSPARKEVSDD